MKRIITTVALAAIGGSTWTATAAVVFTPEVVGATITRRAISVITDDLPANATLRIRATALTGAVIFDKTIQTGQMATPNQLVDWTTNLTGYPWSTTAPTIVVIEFGAKVNGLDVAPFKRVAVGAVTCSGSGQQGSGFANVYPIAAPSTWITPQVDDSGRRPETCETASGWNPDGVAQVADTLRCQVAGGLSACGPLTPPPLPVPVDQPPLPGSTGTWPVPETVTQDGAPDVASTEVATTSPGPVKSLIGAVRATGRSLGLKTVVRGPARCGKKQIRMIVSDFTKVVGGQRIRVVVRACVKR